MDNQNETLQKIIESWKEINEDRTTLNVLNFFDVVQDILSDSELI